MKTSFENIPVDSLKIVSAQNITEDRRIKIFSKGVISFSGFALCQFLEGADLYAEKYTKIPPKVLSLVVKISRHLVLLQSVSNPEIELTRFELLFLQEFLELRMKHCEKERDNRTAWPHNPEALKFNADTYIGQKFLLLDIRELLIGEILED